MFALYSLKHVVSHVSPGAEEGCCVTCFVCSQRSMLCHMFRLGLKKAVVSHVLLCGRRSVLCHMFALELKKAVVSHVSCR